MASYHILIIEDDATLLSTLKYNLEEAGYTISCAISATEARNCFAAYVYDLVVMDINLPDGSGFDLCGELRTTSNVPIVFLTANNLEQDVLKGYGLGADDYITKPFSLNVFVQKIAVLLKRVQPKPNDSYSDGLLYADFTSMDIRFNGNTLQLTPLEIRILKTLVQNPGIVLTRAALLEKLWDMENHFVDEHALTSGMSRLRGKIEQGGKKYIKTIYGMGYMWLGKPNG